MPALVLDVPLGHAFPGGRGDEPRAQTVSGKGGGVVARGRHRCFYHPRDVPVREAGRAEGAVPADAVKDRPRLDAGRLQPSPQRQHRAGAGAVAEGNGDLGPAALLVGLGAAQGDDQPLGDEGQVGHVQRHQLRPPQCRGKADQQQGPVTQGAQPGSLHQGGHGIPDYVRHGGILLRRCGAVGAADAFHGLADGRVAGVEVVAGQAVGLSDRHQAEREAGSLVGGGAGGEERAHRLRQRRQRVQPGRCAPGSEVPPGGAVGAAGVRGRGLVRVGLRRGREGRSGDGQARCGGDDLGQQGGVLQGQKSRSCRGSTIGPRGRRPAAGADGSEAGKAGEEAGASSSPGGPAWCSPSQGAARSRRAAA